MVIDEREMKENKSSQLVTTFSEQLVDWRYRMCETI